MKKGLFVLIILFVFNGFSQIVITEIHFDTPYNENFSVDRDYHHIGEYIELYNYSDRDISLKGWSLTDYIGKYQFPDDAMILSGDYLIIAYRDSEPLQQFNSIPGLSSINYFTQIFPTTIGKENKILYQDKIILRNQRETIRLHVGNIDSTNCNNYKIQEISMGYGYPFERNISTQAYNSPSTYNFYTSSSIHLDNNGHYIEDRPSPLNSDYLPPIQSFETISTVLDALFSNYNHITWENYSNEMLSMTCPLVINKIEQIPSSSYSNHGICFNYDNSGNTTAISDCDPEDQTPLNSTEYSASVLEEINSKIILYPNPTYSSITITWDSSINGVINEIQVSNSSGVTFVTTPVSSTDTEATFDLSMQPTGIYIVRFVLNTNQFLSRNVMKI
ncbi:lamin tail domain-containing protein [Flavobacterium sp.]|uniref:lamin tail domain-containing protein n=1 Tax=Flavobacterium sp. TaxID=239 RepID=UPI00404800EE